MTPTIESLQEKANAGLLTAQNLVTTYSQLKDELRALQAKPKQPVTARVAKGEIYIFIDSYSEVCSRCEGSVGADQYRFDTGNYAADTPEGRAYLERKQRRDLAKVRLERKRDELGGCVAAGAEQAFLPKKYNGAWTWQYKCAAGEFAFKAGDDKAMREFLLSMSADLDIYFGEDNA